MCYNNSIGNFAKIQGDFAMEYKFFEKPFNIKSFSDINFSIGNYTHGTRERHCHNFFELAYIKEGRATHILDGAETKIKSGTYFIVDYGKYHSFYSDGNEKLKLINCLFTAEFIDKSLKNCREFSELLNCYLLKYDCNILMHSPTKTIFRDDDGYVYEILKKMQKEYNRKSVAYSELLRIYLLEIIIHTLRKITDKEIRPNSDCVKRAMSYISENYNKDIRLCDIAQGESYSISHFSRKFHEATGMTFSEYLQRTRIKESCRLLLNTNKKVIEIAYLCGYKDINNFNMLFKKYTGLTPLSFRKGDLYV